MRDPFPTDPKVIIATPPDGMTGAAFSFAIRAKTLEMTVTNPLATLDYGSDDPRFHRGGSDGTFSGTFAW